MSEKENRHGPAPFGGLGTSVSNRGDLKTSKSPQNSATESIPAALKPFLGPQWAVTPKLTMIAGRQLSIGAFPVWNALLNSTIAEGCAVFEVRNSVSDCKYGQKYF
jgi:hypothetical protein